MPQPNPPPSEALANALNSLSGVIAWQQQYNAAAMRSPALHKALADLGKTLATYRTPMQAMAKHPGVLGIMAATKYQTPMQQVMASKYPKFAATLAETGALIAKHADVLPKVRTFPVPEGVLATLPTARVPKSVLAMPKVSALSLVETYVPVRPKPRPKAASNRPRSKKRD